MAKPEQKRRRTLPQRLIPQERIPFSCNLCPYAGTGYIATFQVTGEGAVDNGKISRDLRVCADVVRDYRTKIANYERSATPVPTPDKLSSLTGLLSNAPGTLFAQYSAEGDPAGKGPCLDRRLRICRQDGGVIVEV